MIATEAAFLGFLFAGLISLLAGVGLTRFHWRTDIPAYGRQTSSLDVALHPEKYAKGAPIRAIQCLNLIGAILLACAAGITAYEMIHVIMRP